LLFFYTGFLAGTFLCAMAPTYHFPLIARIMTGIFGGVASAAAGMIVVQTPPGELERYNILGSIRLNDPRNDPDVAREPI